MSLDRLIHLIAWECAPFTTGPGAAAEPAAAEPPSEPPRFASRAERHDDLTEVHRHRERDIPSGFVVAELADALAARGLSVAVTIPLHRVVSREGLVSDGHGAPPFTVRFDGDFHRVTPWHGRTAGGTTVRLLECDEMFGAGEDGPRDLGLRMAFYARAVLQALRTDGGGRAALLHCHAQETALIPTLLKLHHSDERPYHSMRSIFTVHGGLSEATHSVSLLPLVGLTPDRYHPFGPFENQGSLSLTKAALAYADSVTALSPGHAREIEGSAMATSLASARGPLRVQGIRVGIDVASWDPSSDPHLAARFSAAAPEGRAACRAALLREMEILPPTGSAPLMVVTGPLTRDSGADLVLEAVPAAVALGARFVVAGGGEPALVERFASLARSQRDAVAFRAGEDEVLERRLLAGGDACLLPARREYVATRLLRALRYGCLPVATACGGFEDVLVDAGTRRDDANAVVLNAPDAGGLAQALERAVALHAEPSRWAALSRVGLAGDWSWARPAEEHEELYRRLAEPT